MWSVWLKKKKIHVQAPHYSSPSWEKAQKTGVSKSLTVLARQSFKNTSPGSPWYMSMLEDKR